MSFQACQGLVERLCLADCLRHRNPVWPPAPCLPEIFLLAVAVPFPLRPKLEHQRPRCRVVDGYLRLLRREDTPNLELKPLSLGERNVSGAHRKMRNGTIMSSEP